MPKEVITFGCRLNSYESEVINQHIEKSTLKNVAVFNTCAVTKEAERQAKQAIRKYKRENPDTKIIVTGCAAQINPASYEKIEGVDKVVGNEEKLKAKTFDASGFIGDSEKILVNDIMSIKETASQLVGGLEGRARAFMQVQNGCNHRCTFCIIPYGRGNSRSVPIGEIVSQAKILVEKGYNEIVLTGVDISGYGSDLPGEPTLGEMLKRLLKIVPDIKRIRLSSIDVAEIDEDLLWLIENETRLMPHLHLSLQAGDDMILKRMKRRHNRQQVLEFCARVRKMRPDMVFGADIIAGFPTETDEMFENTLKIIHEAGLVHLHIFPYSKREGTPAAKIPNQVPKETRKKRAAKLRQAGEIELAKLRKTRIGKVENVVVESGNIGRTEQFLEVELGDEVDAGAVEVGQLLQIAIKSVKGNKLVG